MQELRKSLQLAPVIRMNPHLQALKPGFFYSGFVLFFAGRQHVELIGPAAQVLQRLAFSGHAALVALAGGFAWALPGRRLAVGHFGHACTRPRWRAAHWL